MIATHVDILTFGDSDTPDAGPADEPRDVQGLEKPDDSVPLTYGKATIRLSMEEYNVYRATHVKAWTAWQEAAEQAELEAAQKAQQSADAKAILSDTNQDPNALLQQAKLEVIVEQLNEVRAKLGMDPVDFDKLETDIATKIDAKLDAAAVAVTANPAPVPLTP
jgi:hypothetical protein